jgi:superfamily II DNA or RNA helicase
MEIIKVRKLNEVYNKFECDPGVAYELNDYFTFTVPGAKFMPLVRNKIWDGKIRLFNVMTCTLYGGLNRYVEEFCKARKYDLEYLTDFSSDEFSVIEAKQFVQTLNLNPKYTPRDYQLEAFVHAVRERRALMLSPTASGKSFIIYLLMRYYNAKTLIIVPTTTLVHQLEKDFRDYGYTDGGIRVSEERSGERNLNNRTTKGTSSEHRAMGEQGFGQGSTSSGIRFEHSPGNSTSNEWTSGIHKIYSGQEKGTQAQVTITTWQSVYKLPQKWFDQFDVVVGDEAHLFKAKSLTSIMEKLENCKYRFGFTGTLDGSQTHKLVLEGLFGPVRNVTTTAKLIDDKHLSAFKIKAIVLSYPDEIRKMIIKANDYQSEIDYLVRLEARNNFIKNLALSLEGNTLLLFQFVDKHGQVLYDKLKNKVEGRNVYFIHGGVDGEERDRVREIVEKENNAIIVASFGTFSTGINIRNLHNLIFASPSKSRIRNLQSIGRVLRTGDTKTEATLFDIADDLSWKSKKNFTLLHFMDRVGTYNEEKFNYKIYKVALTF